MECLKTVYVVQAICLVFLSSAFCSSSYSQTRFPIGTCSEPANSEVELTLSHRFQAYNPKPTTRTDVYDKHIVSPKSVNILDRKKKFYIHALEDQTTRVYTLYDFIPIATIHHSFNESNQHLFNEGDLQGFDFPKEIRQVNHFHGKPVESCFSHNGKFLWVTYYRRSFDKNAVSPSAVCIIDTDTDQIVRVMPTAPLPKMISCSPDSKTIAITNWGDNSVTLINTSSSNPADFSYVKTIVIDRKPSNKFNQTEVNRDSNCDNCLRGTVFSPEGKYLFVAKMGGNGIAVIDLATNNYMGTVTGLKSNIRHIICNNEELYWSTNKGGYIQKIKLSDLQYYIEHDGLNTPLTAIQTVDVGEGVRTIVLDPTSKYIFAAANNDSKIVVVRASDLSVVASCSVDSYPVGMDISEDGHWLITTSQERENGGGRCVCVFNVRYNQ